MEEILKEFKQFLADLEKRLSSLDLDLYRYPADHVCYRVETNGQYQKLAKLFKNHSVLYTEKFFHDRNFCLFVLKDPLTYKKIEVPYLEFSQPGGSDNYKKGFQHIEFHTNVQIESVFKSKKQAKELLFTGKYGDEVYLKWPDKIVLKFTPKNILTKSLLEDDSKIYLG